MHQFGEPRSGNRTGRIRFHARTRAFAGVSEKSQSFHRPLSCPNQAAVLEADQRHSNCPTFRFVVKINGLGTAGEEMFSVLARGAWFRQKSFFYRGDRGIFGIYSQQPGEPRAMSAGRGLEMVVGQILPQRTTMPTAPQFADDSRIAGRSSCISRPQTSTGKASGTQLQYPSSVAPARIYVNPVILSSCDQNSMRKP
jgi:hypothetical protein